MHFKSIASFPLSTLWSNISGGFVKHDGRMYSGRDNGSYSVRKRHRQAHTHTQNTKRVCPRQAEAFFIIFRTFTDSQRKINENVNKSVYAAICGPSGMISHFTHPPFNSFKPSPFRPLMRKQQREHCPQLSLTF